MHKPLAEIFGHVERITFQNAENGFTVAQLKEASKKDLTCIVGCLPTIKPGESLHLEGEWKQNSDYGLQFLVKNYTTKAPADVLGIKKYLGSGLIKGIGPTYAKRIVDTFGEDTLIVIDKHPEKLEFIDGLGKKRIASITSSWQEQKSIRDVMIFLQSHDISPSFAQKIFKEYGNASIQIVSSNPYSLAKNIRGIGFKSADQIAQKMGVPKDSVDRFDAGIEYALSEATNDGHMCLPVSELLLIAGELLETTPNVIEERLIHLQKDNRIEISQMVYLATLERFVWLRMFFKAETGICRQLTRIKFGRSLLRQIDTGKAIAWAEELLNIRLAEHQKEAVSKALTDKIHIITGGPGTGKSTITKAILKVTEKLTDKIILAAPTGRAAKRMTEITQKKAFTIHALLEFDFKKGGFKRGFDNPLECDLIIVDEASMIDTLLMNSLLKAIPDHCRLILVGDVNQLPSVGPGNVLKDMIESHIIAVTGLTEIFRQARGSRITINAHRINKGTFPEIKNEEDSDFFFIKVDDTADVLRDIVALVGERLPKKYGLNPFTEIQVLSPMRRGIIGTENLNTVLQEHLNPRGTPLTWGGRKYLVGDKVMQIRNNYKRAVFNGDIGCIQSISAINHEVVVKIDENDVVYDFKDLDELVLAYAVSIHKYQGSECPCVVMPIHTTHFKLLHRNLLYTGVTRGKRLVVLVGTTQAIALAVKNDEVKRRHTGLKQALISAFSTNLNLAL